MKLRSTVKAYVLDSVGRILVFRRVKHGSDFWQLPGGGIENGESPEVALERELGEELGHSSFKVLTRLPFEREGYRFQNDRFEKHVTFFAAWADSAVPLRLEAGHAEYRWANPEELSELFSYDEQRRDLECAVQFLKDASLL